MSFVDPVDLVLNEHRKLCQGYRAVVAGAGEACNMRAMIKVVTDVEGSATAGRSPWIAENGHVL
ncbi:hypothetical protein [Streptosporangium roseum]|uniref:hypothetical protein n=1 Tax=Streptosporangium roseum TaxID=2001 RepID=UPI0003245C7C|nr:hypothetical protein [Streptosporangium roseum]